MDKPAFLHTTEIDRSETQAHDQVTDGFLCISILSRQEQHTAATLKLGARSKRLSAQMIERLHNPCFGRPLRYELARRTAAKINSMERWHVVGADSYLYRIVGVD
ncbi:hypothetical protein WM28_22875 [Burkholderia ubonensis]|nr:hypothetical protein WM28_22875 [Burkholderia ubonensis]